MLDLTGRRPRLVDTFPSALLGLTETGVVATSATLDVETALQAYPRGIFPWPEGPGRVYWCSPDPRAVLYPNAFHASRRLQRSARAERVRMTVDRSFTEVLEQCAAPRPGRMQTWITADYQQVFIELHQRGHAHSAEAWVDDELIGGVYGLEVRNGASGAGWFAAESMYSARTDGSKYALWALCRWLAERDCQLIDTQLLTSHLASLGAVEIPRPDFLCLIGAL